MSFTEQKIPKPSLIDTTVSNFNLKQTGYDKLPSEEKDFYYWVNYSRINLTRFMDSVVHPVILIYPQLNGENLKSLKNDFSKTAFLPLLQLNNQLTQMAKAHSLDITSHKAKPSHSSTNGETFPDRFKNAGFIKCGGENISYGNKETLFHLVLLYLDINVPDLGHRKALLNANFIETGIGSSFYPDGSVFIVEDFACTQK